MDWGIKAAGVMVRDQSGAVPLTLDADGRKTFDALVAEQDFTAGGIAATNRKLEDFDRQINVVNSGWFIGSGAFDRVLASFRGVQEQTDRFVQNLTRGGVDQEKEKLLLSTKYTELRNNLKAYLDKKEAEEKKWRQRGKLPPTLPESASNSHAVCLSSPRIGCIT